MKTIEKFMLAAAIIFVMLICYKLVDLALNIEKENNIFENILVEEVKESHDK